MNDIELGERLRYCRQARGVTQEFLGNAAEITFQQIQKYERGTNRISVSMLYKLCRVLGITVGNFLGEEIVKDVPLPLKAPDMLKLYMKCNKSGQQALRAMAKELAKT